MYSLACFGIFGDPCKLIAGQTCNVGAESYMMKVNGIGFLYVSLLFGILTHLNKDNVPKLRRLVLIAINATFLMAAGIIFTGPQRLGGVEINYLHILDVLGIFILLGILIRAVMDDSTIMGVQSTTSIFEGLGINAKSFVALITVVAFLKLLAFCDFVSYETFLSNPDTKTQLSDVFWDWIKIAILDICLALFFALAYGNRQDHEAVTITILVMSLLSIIVFYPMRNMFKEGLFVKVAIPGVCSVACIAIVAVVGGRMKGNNGYSQIGS